MKTNTFKLIIAIGLMACNSFAQTPTNFVTIPANQYGQHGGIFYSACDTVGTGRTMDLDSTKLAFLLYQHPDTFSLFVVENVRNYPTTISIYDTLTISKASSTNYNYVTKHTKNGKITQVSTNPLQYNLIYKLPVFTSYQQWKNSFVLVHFKLKGNNTLFTVKDTTTRANVISPINLKTNGLIISSGDLKNKVNWTIIVPYNPPINGWDTVIFNQATISMLWDATYQADENSVYSDYVNNEYLACTTSARLKFKAIKDSTGNGLLKAPEQFGAIYQWYYQGKPIANATSNTYQASASGTYGVSVTFDFATAVANLRTEGSNMVTGNYSFKYTATITEIETDIINPKDKTLVRIYNPLGQTIKPEEANDGIFIYQYSDGSTRKVMKSEK
jgi:hypothetical protein